MANRHTSITLPGSRAGYVVEGRLSVPDIVANIRGYAERTKAMAEEILEAKDEDFRVVTHLGRHLRRKPVVLQEGRRKDG